MMTQQIGDRIRVLRTESNLTQQQLADLLKVSNKAVSKWENNEGLPDIENLKRISSVFSVSLDQLTGQVEPNPKEVLNQSGYIVIGLIAMSLVLIFVPFLKINLFNTDVYGLGSISDMFGVTNNYLGLEFFISQSGFQLFINGFSHATFANILFLMSIFTWFGLNVLSIIDLVKKESKYLRMGLTGSLLSSGIIGAVVLYLSITDPDTFSATLTSGIIFGIQILVLIFAFRNEHFYEIK